jgi:hypothetical protein
MPDTNDDKGANGTEQEELQMPAVMNHLWREDS